MKATHAAPTTVAKSFNDSYWTVEVLMMGGLSIIACLCTWAFVDKGAPLLAASQLAFSLAFVANHPHFLSSYVLLYGDYRERIFKQPRYFISGVVVPIVLLAVLVTALATSSQALMSHLITGMFFLVGWHYVKQIFGCVIVTSAQRKIFYSPNERRLMLGNLFATWFMSWLLSQVKPLGAAGPSDSAFSFYGIGHYRLDLPYWTLQWTYWAVAVSLVAVGIMHVQKYIKTGQKPSPPGVVAFVALYAWYLPVASHPSFSYFIPLFHSLQYLTFVWRLKFNQVGFSVRELKGEVMRREWVQQFWGFMLTATALGALFFEFIPNALDGQHFVSGLGTSPFLASFLLFINTHHYFIDNAIWRSDNVDVKKFLFQPMTGMSAASEASKSAA